MDLYIKFVAMGMSLALALALFSNFLLKRWWSSKAIIRARERQIGDDLVAPEITLDLMIEIMIRLPPKSLMRFKCVSKLWFSLIRSRYFSNFYLTLASPPPSPRMYMSLMKDLHHHLECDSMEVCHQRGKSLMVSLTSPSSNNDESFDCDLTMPGLGLGAHDMVVLRGLILYKVCRHACIYNPTTRQNVTLPAVKSNIFSQEGYSKDVVYIFGHDPVLDQYKVICTISISSEDYVTVISEHWVFVLEVGGLWKRIESNQPHCPSEQGVSINGVIYYLAYTGVSSRIIVRFGIRSEEFSMIQAPDDWYEFSDFMTFIEYSGKPAIFDYTNLPHSGLVDLWVLEDGGKWSKKSQNLQACQMHLVDDDIDLQVIDTTRNNNVILVPIKSHFYILYYDVQKNDLRKVDHIRGIPDHGLIDPYICVTFMDRSESIMHLET